MVSAVSIGRLELVRYGKQYNAFRAPDNDLAAIMQAVRAALGLH
jgi:hypothetical protein